MIRSLRPPHPTREDNPSVWVPSMHGAIRPSPPSDFELMCGHVRVRDALAWLSSMAQLDAGGFFWGGCLGVLALRWPRGVAYSRQTVQSEMSLHAVTGKLQRQVLSASELAGQLDREKSEKATAQAAAAAAAEQAR